MPPLSPSLWTALLGAGVVCLILLWQRACVRRSKSAATNYERQFYRQRAGLLLVLCALLAVNLLHLHALLEWLGRWQSH